jgi:hypothetical protein
MSLQSAITVSANHKAKHWKQGLTSLILNKLSDLLSMMDAAVVEYKYALWPRIRIGKGDLYKFE